jgi:hypothetical protein
LIPEDPFPLFTQIYLSRLAPFSSLFHRAFLPFHLIRFFVELFVILFDALFVPVFHLFARQKVLNLDRREIFDLFLFILIRVENFLRVVLRRLFKRCPHHLAHALFHVFQRNVSLFEIFAFFLVVLYIALVETGKYEL